MTLVGPKEDPERRAPGIMWDVAIIEALARPNYQNELLTPIENTHAS